MSVPSKPLQGGFLSAGGSAPTVLVADYEAVNHKILADMLRREGHTAVLGRTVTKPQPFSLGHIATIVNIPSTKDPYDCPTGKQYYKAVKYRIVIYI